MILDIERIKKRRIKDGLIAGFKRCVPNLKVKTAAKVEEIDTFEPIVVACRLAELVNAAHKQGLSEWSAQWHRQPTAVLGVVQTDEDEGASQNVDMMMRSTDRRFWIVPVKTEKALQSLEKQNLYARILDSTKRFGLLLAGG
jgi:hypothetical protein